VNTLEIKIVLCYFVIILVALGLASWAQPRPRPDVIASPEPDEPPKNFEPSSPTLAPRRRAITSPLPGELPTRREFAPPFAEPAPGSRSGNPTSGPECPLGRVAMVRGSDSEAREGGGFEAARANGLHGAVDLDGYLGEPVFAVVDGKVQLTVERDQGKLGKTVVVDHLDGRYTIYGHLRTIDVKRGSSVTAGQVLGTMGYSGNARRLQEKNLPPHLHFAYVRGTVPFAGIRAVDGSGTSFARNNAMAEMTSVLHPMRAVGFRKCWEDPTSLSPTSGSPGSRSGSIPAWRGRAG
jgi:murein DD-endopeptidase MepM/ murein hydrolase activator NlpD